MTRPQEGLTVVVTAAIEHAKRHGLRCGRCGGRDRLRYEVEFDPTIFGSPLHPLVRAVPLCYRCDDLMLTSGSRPRSLWARVLVAVGCRRFEAPRMNDLTRDDG